MGTYVAHACFTYETKTSLWSSEQIVKVLGGYCGYLRTEDEVVESKHWAKAQIGIGKVGALIGTCH